VVDSSGGFVPQASVEVTNEGTGGQRHLTADDAGNFVAVELPVGFYTVKVNAQNLAPFAKTHVKVDVGADTRVDVMLAPAGQAESVTVTADTPQMERDSATLAEVINNRQVESLPLNGRDFRKLAFLIPGAAPRTPRGSFGSFSVNGQREKSNIFLVDGVDNNDSFRQQPSFNQGGVANAPATLFPVDALGEFSVQSQGSAEYGRNSGAVLNIVIKSGAEMMPLTLPISLKRCRVAGRVPSKTTILALLLVGRFCTTTHFSLAAMKGNASASHHPSPPRFRLAQTSLWRMRKTLLRVAPAAPSAPPCWRFFPRPALPVQTIWYPRHRTRTAATTSSSKSTTASAIVTT
jgi:hypothetical protein